MGGSRLRRLLGLLSLQPCQLPAQRGDLAASGGEQTHVLVARAGHRHLFVEQRQLRRVELVSLGQHPRGDILLAALQPAEAHGLRGDVIPSQDHRGDDLLIVSPDPLGE